MYTSTHHFVCRLCVSCVIHRGSSGANADAEPSEEEEPSDSEGEGNFMLTDAWDKPASDDEIKSSKKNKKHKKNNKSDPVLSFLQSDDDEESDEDSEGSENEEEGDHTAMLNAITAGSGLQESSKKRKNRGLESNLAGPESEWGGLGDLGGGKNTPGGGLSLTDLLGKHNFNSTKQNTSIKKYLNNFFSLYIYI